MLPLCHTVVRARKSPLPGGAFSDRRYGWSCGRITECRIQKKHTAVEVLPVGDLSETIGLFFLFVGDATKVPRQKRKKCIPRSTILCTINGMETR